MIQPGTDPSAFIDQFIEIKALEFTNRHCSSSCEQIISPFVFGRDDSGSFTVAPWRHGCHVEQFSSRQFDHRGVVLKSFTAMLLSGSVKTFFTHILKMKIISNVRITPYLFDVFHFNMFSLNILENVNWAANKSFEVLKFNFNFPGTRTFELFRARSRLYRSQVLQVNTRWKALAEIYTVLVPSVVLFFKLNILL